MDEPRTDRAKTLRQDSRSGEDVYGEPIYDVDEAAKRLGVDGSTIRRHIQNGDIIAFKLGKKYRIAQSDLRDFVARLRQESLDKVRDESLTRDLRARSARLQANAITAKEWGQTPCRQCTRPVLVQQQRNEDDSRRGWKGTCGWCQSELDLPLLDAASFAAVKEDRMVQVRRYAAWYRETYSRRQEGRTHAYTICTTPRCIAPVIVALDETAAEPRWQGVCSVCQQRVDKPRDQVASLAADAAEEDRKVQLRMEIAKQIDDAARHMEIAEQVAVVPCDSFMCDEKVLIVHLVSRDGEDRWVGNCPFCKTPYDQPRSASPSLAEMRAAASAQESTATEDDLNMDDIPF